MIEETQGYTTAQGFSEEVVETFLSHNISLEDEQVFAFYLYLSKQVEADEALLVLESHGYECEISKNDFEGLDYLLYATLKITPTPKNLEAAGDLFIGLRQKFKGDFDGWEIIPSGDEAIGNFEMDEALYEQMAENILQTSMESYKVPVKFCKPDYKEFSHLDMNYYEDMQKQLEVAGFEYLDDSENLNVTEQGNVKTFARIMYHKKDAVLANFYYVDILRQGFIEFDSLLSDGKALVTTNASEANEICGFDILLSQHRTELEVEALYALHRNILEKYLKENTDVQAQGLESIEKMVEFENYVSKHKYEKLKSIGWVTKEYLFNMSGEDEVLTEGVFQVIQRKLQEA